MKSSSELLFDNDVKSASFVLGTANGTWGLAGPGDVGCAIVWPQVVICIEAAPRSNAPNRYYFNLNLDGYRNAPPTGTFWDAGKHTTLPVELRPKGKANSRFAKVFRTDWNNSALYHPYDRVAAGSHPDWRGAQPHRVWTPEHTIVDYVVEIHLLLNGSDYVGI